MGGEDITIRAITPLREGERREVRVPQYVTRRGERALSREAHVPGLLCSACIPGQIALVVRVVAVGVGRRYSGVRTRHGRCSHGRIGTWRRHGWYSRRHFASVPVLVPSLLLREDGLTGWRSTLARSPLFLRPTSRG